MTKLECLFHLVSAISTLAVGIPVAVCGATVDEAKSPEPVSGVLSAAKRYELGRSLVLGEGSLPDPEKGAVLVREAAEEGLAAAQGFYGYLLSCGLGVEPDEEAAAEWLGRAAAGGNASAQLNLGLLLLDREEGRKETDAALGWLEKAAEQGRIEAQSKLAEIHYFGLAGCEQSFERALPWARLAAEGGSAWAQNLFASMLEWGQGLVIDRALAKTWYRRAAEKGDAKAQANLGRLIATGLAGDRDMVEAYYWFWQSMEQGEITGTNGIKEILPSMTEEERHAALRRVGIDPERIAPKKERR